MTAPRTLRAAFVVGAILLLVLTAAPAKAASLTGKRQHKPVVMTKPSEGAQPAASGLPTGKRQHKPTMMMNQPASEAPSASGPPAGKGMHLPLHIGTEPLVSGEKPPLPLAQPSAGASSQALKKIPTHQPPWTNPKLHDEGLAEPGMVHPPDPINPASKVGGATPDPGIKPGPSAASGQGLTSPGGETAGIAGIRNEQLNNKYPENMKHEVGR